MICDREIRKLFSLSNFLLHFGLPIRIGVEGGNE